MTSSPEHCMDQGPEFLEDLSCRDGKPMALPNKAPPHPSSFQLFPALTLHQLNWHQEGHMNHYCEADTTHCMWQWPDSM